MLISVETHIHTFYFPGGVRTPYPLLDPHMGNVIITGQYLSQSRFLPYLSGIDLSGLMTDEVFK